MASNFTSPQSRPVRTRPSVASPPSTASSQPSSNQLGGTGAKSYHDPTIQELCSLETFQNNFNTNDFIAQLSSKLIQRSKADPGPFNPRPFIRTFEGSLDQLVQIRAQVTSQLQELASSVHVAESAYTKKLDELSKNFSAVGNSFSSLEDRISEVGRTAIRIGEQLEMIDKQRNRASEAHDLIEFYYMFARGDTSKLERIRKEGGKDGRMKTAIIARRLAAISREVDVKGSEQTREAIDRYCERFERDMLKLFDKFYRKSDPKMMGHIAKVLQGFNGGGSCVQIYVNQHDFFISKDRVGEANRIELSEIWRSMADSDQPPPKSEPSLSSLFSEIRQTVEIEAQIISAVFPNPLVVMQTFLQRVFAQSVQGFVEVIMDKAGQILATSFVGFGGIINQATGALELQPSVQPIPSHLAFLRALHMSRSCALSLVNDLKTYDFRGAGIVAPSNPALTNSGVSESGALSLFGGDGSAATASHLAHAGGSALAVMLDQAVEELFVPYMEGVRYLEKESKSLMDLYAVYLFKFITYHKTPKKKEASNTIFNRMRNQISATSELVNPSSSTTSSTTSSTASAMAGAKSSFFKLSNLADRVRGGGSSAAVANPPQPNNLPDVPANDPATNEVEEKEGELSLDMAERVLRWHAEAIGRCVDLSSSSEVPKNTFALLKVLTSAYIKTYVETALDSAITAVSQQDVRGPQLPDLSALSVIRNAELIIALWQHYVNTALLPLASTSVTVRREMMIYNNHNLLRVEGKCDTLMQKMADNVFSYLTNRLATQKKNDFAPKNDELTFSRMNTEPCVACSEALEKVNQIARMTLSFASTSGPSSMNRNTLTRPGSSSSRSVYRDSEGPVTNADIDEDSELATGYKANLSRNAESFLTEIGIAFHGLLLEHLRKYTVSATGGLMLTNDLTVYRDAISTFNIPTLSDRFEMLRQLGNLFIVQPAVLKSYMREGHLAKIDERLLRPYLLRRADYAKDVRDLNDIPSTPLASAHGDGYNSPIASSSSTRDFFGHIPNLINGSLSSTTSPANSYGGSTSTEAIKLQRLADVLQELEDFSSRALTKTKGVATTGGSEPLRSNVKEPA